MKFSAHALAFVIFSTVANKKATASTWVNVDECSSDDLAFHCPSPESSTSYETALGTYVESDGLTWDEEVSTVAEDIGEVFLYSVAGYYPLINAAIQVVNFYTGYTSSTESDDTIMMSMIDQALSQIIDDFNDSMDETYDYIDDRFDEAMNYTNFLHYYDDISTIRNGLIISLTDFQNNLQALENQGFATLEDAIAVYGEYDVKSPISKDIDDAITDCQKYFGLPSLDQDIEYFDDGFEYIRYKIMFSTEICTACMDTFAAAAMIYSTAALFYKDDFQYIMSRCVLEVQPLTRDHIAEETAWVQYGGMQQVSGEILSSWGTYYDPDEAWTGDMYFKNSESYYSDSIRLQSQDRIESCVEEDFSDFLQYTLDWEKDGITGVYAYAVTHACIAYNKMGIDNELMDFYRANVIDGYGDSWARSLAQVNQQGLVSSYYSPRTTGSFALMSTYWAMFVDNIDELSTSKIYFTFQQNDDGTYTITSDSTNTDLCDGSNCDWNLVQLYNFAGYYGTSDPTRYVFQNANSGKYLTAATEADYTADDNTEDDANNFRLVYYSNTPTIHLTLEDEIGERSHFRLIRDCEDTLSADGECQECTSDSDCDSATPLCSLDYNGSSNNICVACYDDSDCSGNLVCSSDASSLGLCVDTTDSGYECEEDSDCDSGYCSPEDNTCYECFQDSHCDTNSWCSSNTCHAAVDALCVSGEKKVTLKDVDGTEIPTKIKHLEVGNVIRGVNENMEPTDCTVTAIGKYKAKKMYGGYTADHSIFSDSESGMVMHGRKGEETFEDTYDVLTDCPLSTDEQDVHFSGFGHCGRGTLDWSDYITLYDALSGLVEEGNAHGINFYSSSTWNNMGNLAGKAAVICDQILACDASDDDNSAECAALEATLETTMETEVKAEHLTTIRNRVPKLGQAGADGSATKLFREKRRKRKNDIFIRKLFGGLFGY